MAARTAIVALTSTVTRTRLYTPTLRAPLLAVLASKPPSSGLLSGHRSLHATPFRPADTISSAAAAAAAAATPSANTTENAIKTPQAEPVPGEAADESGNSAFLGEADRDDGFESYKDAYGKEPESLDASNSAYLGEADGDDGFESRKDIDGETFEAVDATQSAYLGEADSDDAFESDKDLNPERHVHKIEDASTSGEHGQPGEGDQ